MRFLYDFDNPEFSDPDPDRSSRTMLHQYLLEKESTAVCMDGYDDAVCGVLFDGEKDRVIYCYASMVACLMRDGMSSEEATEYLHFNTIAALPDGGPMIIDQAFPVTIQIREKDE
tara:strand:- start:35 stop:379 length:345 start_codon:yes stop_codon:yes gene_type:complete